MYTPAPNLSAPPSGDDDGSAYLSTNQDGDAIAHANTGVLEFAPETARGAFADYRPHRRLNSALSRFSNKEAAAAFAEKHGLPYRIDEPTRYHKRRLQAEQLPLRQSS